MTCAALTIGHWSTGRGGADGALRAAAAIAGWQAACSGEELPSGGAHRMQLKERHEPMTDGMFVTLWLADVGFAAEFWMVRALQVGVRGLAAGPLVAAVLLAAGGGVAYELPRGLSGAQERTALLDL